MLRPPPYDVEGNDDPASERNVLDVASLDLFGSLSVAMKRGGYLTTMVPPESYLDPTDDRFDTRLNLTYDGEFDGVYFPHHGRNCYAYLLAKYGYTKAGSCPIRSLVHSHFTHSFHSLDVSCFYICITFVHSINRPITFVHSISRPITFVYSHLTAMAIHIHTLSVPQFSPLRVERIYTE